MKIFVTKCIILLLIVGTITLEINQAYKCMDGANVEGTDKFTEIPQHIQICNFGSSHGMNDFNYDNYSELYECFNFGLGSQTLQYDYRLFQNYKDRIDVGAVVLIPVSYFSFWGVNETDASIFQSVNKKYYRILPPHLIREYDWTTDIYVRYLPAISVSTDELLQTLKGNKNVDKFESDWSRYSYDIDVIADAKRACNRHLVAEKLDDNGDRIVNQEAIDALYGLVEGCREIGANPILITTPYLREYTDEVSKVEGFYQEFYSMMDKVTTDLNVEYYDYAFDERFIDRYEVFMNSDHLNKEGAKEFVDIVMGEILSCYLTI